MGKWSGLGGTAVNQSSGQSFYDDIYRIESRHEGCACLAHAVINYFQTSEYFNNAKDPLILFLLFCKYTLLFAMQNKE